jgi:hypothetical protein
MACCLLCSCDIDTITEPDGIISGKIRNALATNAEEEIFWTEQPNGFEVVYLETSWTGSESRIGVSFWGKADGSFYNSRLFPATYTITPTNGAFHSAGYANEVEVRSGVETPQLVFDVIPYCSFHEVSVEKDPVKANTVVVKFQVTTNPVADNPDTEEVDETVKATIRNWRVFVTSRTPYVGANIFDADVSTASDQDMTASQLGETIVWTKSGFVPGTKYYLRIGARCTESPKDRYNMTKIYEIEF